MNTKIIGDIGENLATAYLENLGYVILHRNFVIGNIEIDIVAKDSDGTIVFCEVKTRENTKYGRPLEAVGYAKQKRYIKAANLYIVKNRILDTNFRFDVIEILAGDANHLISAFEC